MQLFYTDYDNWLEEVILHEYTHILSLDTTSGYSAIMGSIFGKPMAALDPLSFIFSSFTMPPNIYMPPWWVEGIATYSESRFTNRGRGKSTAIDTFFRISVAENNLRSIDELIWTVPYWPRGTWYLYGMLIEKYTAEKYGEESINKLTKSLSGRLTYSLNQPIKDLTGKSYKELYQDVINNLKEDQNKKIEYLETQPFTQFKRLPVDKDKDELLSIPRFSPNKRFISAVRTSSHKHSDIVIFDSMTYREIAGIRSLPSETNISWSPGGDKLYFSQAKMQNSYNFFHDIYQYDINKKSIQRLTNNARALYPTISPDGKYIAFVKIETDKQDIAMLELNTQDIKIIKEFKDSSLSSPSWSTDGKNLVFSRHNNKGQTSIEILNIWAKTIEVLLSDNKNNSTPIFSPDNNYIIFASDKTGVYNLFAYNLKDKKTYQITHLLGGAFQPDVSKDLEKILFTNVDSKGFYISEMPYNPSKWSEKLSPQIKPSFYEYNQDDIISKALDNKEQIKISEPVSYNPIPTLLPKFWLPSWVTTDNKGPVFGALTGGEDVLGYHNYLLQAGYGGSNRTYLNLNYNYQQQRPLGFNLQAYSLPQGYSGFFDNEGSYYERRSALSLGASYSLYHNVETKLNLIAGYSIEKTNHITDINGRTSDGRTVFEGQSNNIFTSIAFDNTIGYPYSISKEEGRSITFTYRYYDKTIGSDLNLNKYAINYKEYMGLWKHNVFYLNLKGATSRGDDTAQQSFSLGGISSIINNTYTLRGFPSGFKTGRHIITGTTEYRLPLFYIFKGWDTKPIFLNSIHTAFFLDIGNTFNDNQKIKINNFSTSAGIELKSDITLSYWLPITPAIGMAKKLTDNKNTQLYFTVYANF